MIILIVAGFVALAAVVIVVVIDAVQASAWREIARDRRRNWEESRRLEPHGGEPWTDAGQDD